MSVQDQIDRISNAKTDIANALGEKGVEVSEGTSIDEMGDLIRSIPVGETNVIESISVNSVSLPIENKNVNIDLTGYANVNQTNTYAVAQTYSGQMPNTSSAIENTVTLGKSVYVFGTKTNNTWNEYSLLNAGQLNLQSPKTGGGIVLNTKSTLPNVTVKDATNGQRNFTFGATGGTLATEDYADTVGANVWEKIYPVGAIYISTEATSPASLFGGSWVIITNRFLLAQGSLYSAGSTNSKSTVTLTEENLPPHLHTVAVKGRAKLTGTASATSGGASNAVRISNNAYEYLSGIVDKNNINSVSYSSIPTGQVIAEAKDTDATSFSILPPYQAVYMWQRVS